jgi:hypothetical protein
MAGILSSERERIVAAVDVRRGGASVTLVSLDGRKPARFLATGHSTLSLEKRDRTQQVAALQSHLEEAGTIALKTYAATGAHPTVQSVHVVLHAPISGSEIVYAHAEYEHPVIVTHEMLVALAKDALNTRSVIDGMQLLDAGLNTVRLNGYPVKRAEGKRARTISLSSIISDTDPECRNAAMRAIRTLFPVAAIVWRSGIRALLTVLRESKPHLHEYLVVDMGLEATHIVSVRDGEPVQQRVVEEGMRTVLERIAPGKPPEETIGYLRMLGKDACEGKACETMQTSISEAEPELARILGEALGSIASVRRVPNTLIVLVDADLQPWLSRFLTRIDFAQFTVTALPFTVEALAPSDLEALIAPDPSLDTGTALGAALVNIEERSLVAQ